MGVKLCRFLWGIKRDCVREQKPSLDLAERKQQMNKRTLYSEMLHNLHSLQSCFIPGYTRRCKENIKIYLISGFIKGRTILTTLATTSFTRTSLFSFYFVSSLCVGSIQWRKSSTRTTQLTPRLDTDTSKIQVSPASAQCTCPKRMLMDFEEWSLSKCFSFPPSDARR